MKTYLIFDGIYYKIGRTTNIEKRFKTIKSNNPNAILLAYINSDIEQELHNKYREYVYYNEWFLIKDENITKELLNEYNIHIEYINKEVNISSKDKMRVGTINSAKVKSTRTIKRIIDAKEWLQFMEQKPTQKKVLDLTGLSIATIKRNWNKKIIN